MARVSIAEEKAIVLREAAKLVRMSPDPETAYCVLSEAALRVEQGEPYHGVIRHAIATLEANARLRTKESR
jgi:hypothetical protein